MQQGPAKRPPPSPKCRSNVNGIDSFETTVLRVLNKNAMYTNGAPVPPDLLALALVLEAIWNGRVSIRSVTLVIRTNGPICVKLAVPIPRSLLLA